MSHNIEITFSLTIEADKTAESVQAVEFLADVMLVQAEDGLYLLGWKDAETLVFDDGTAVENRFIGDISVAAVKRIVEVP